MGTSPCDPADFPEILRSANEFSTKKSARKKTGRAFARPVRFFQRCIVACFAAYPMLREHFPEQPHPAGGPANPPEPEGMPLGRTHPADICFSTRSLRHSGQGGSGSEQDRTMVSN